MYYLYKFTLKWNTDASPVIISETLSEFFFDELEGCNRFNAKLVKDDQSLYAHKKEFVVDFETEQPLSDLDETARNCVEFLTECAELQSAEFRTEAHTTIKTGLHCR
jgi:hypothetical protein